MKGIVIGVLCNVGYYLFVLSIYLMSNASFKTIESISVMIIIRYMARIILAYFILSFIYSKVVKSKNKSVDKTTEE